MSKLFDVKKMYGQNFNIVTTNAPSSFIKNSNQLLANTILISSPEEIINDETKDNNYPTLFVTDYEANPLQLTYPLYMKNGLYYDETLGYAYINIDNKTIQPSNDGIGTLYVNTNHLNHVSSDNYGVTKIQESIDNLTRNFSNIDNIGNEYKKSSFINATDEGILYINDSLFELINKIIESKVHDTLQDIKVLLSNNLKMWVSITNITNIDVDGKETTILGEESNHTINQGFNDYKTIDNNQIIRVTFNFNMVSFEKNSIEVTINTNDSRDFKTFPQNSNQTEVTQYSNLNNELWLHTIKDITIEFYPNYFISNNINSNKEYDIQFIIKTTNGLDTSIQNFQFVQNKLFDVGEDLSIKYKNNDSIVVKEIYNQMLLQESNLIICQGNLTNNYIKNFIDNNNENIFDFSYTISVKNLNNENNPELITGTCKYNDHIINLLNNENVQNFITSIIDYDENEENQFQIRDEYRKNYISEKKNLLNEISYYVTLLTNFDIKVNNNSIGTYTIGTYTTEQEILLDLSSSSKYLFFIIDQTNYSNPNSVSSAFLSSSKQYYLCPKTEDSFSTVTNTVLSFIRQDIDNSISSIYIPYNGFTIYDTSTQKTEEETIDDLSKITYLSNQNYINSIEIEKNNIKINFNESNKYSIIKYLISNGVENDNNNTVEDSFGDNKINFKLSINRDNIIKKMLWYLKINLLSILETNTELKINDELINDITENLGVTNVDGETILSNINDGNDFDILAKYMLAIPKFSALYPNEDFGISNITDFENIKQYRLKLPKCIKLLLQNNQDIFKIQYEFIHDTEGTQDDKYTITVVVTYNQSNFVVNIEENDKNYYCVNLEKDDENNDIIILYRSINVDDNVNDIYLDMLNTITFAIGTTSKIFYNDSIKIWNNYYLKEHEENGPEIYKNYYNDNIKRNWQGINIEDFNENQNNYIDKGISSIYLDKDNVYNLEGAQYSNDNENWHDEYQVGDQYIKINDISYSLGAQYSSDNETWHDEYQEDDQYIKLNGTSYRLEGAQYSSDNETWHAGYQAGDQYIKIDNISYSLGAQYSNDNENWHEEYQTDDSWIKINNYKYIVVINSEKDDKDDINKQIKFNGILRNIHNSENNGYKYYVLNNSDNTTNSIYYTVCYNSDNSNNSIVNISDLTENNEYDINLKLNPQDNLINTNYNNTNYKIQVLKDFDNIDLIYNGDSNPIQLEKDDTTFTINQNTHRYLNHLYIQHYEIKQIKYSSDNETWHDEYQEDDQYIKLNGTSYHLESAQYSSDNETWHDEYQEDDQYIKIDDISYSLGAQYSSDNENWHTEWKTDDQYIKIYNYIPVQGLVNNGTIIQENDLTSSKYICNDAKTKYYILTYTDNNIKHISKYNVVFTDSINIDPIQNS